MTGRTPRAQPDHDIARFGPPEMVRLAAELRTVAEHATGFADAARRVVRRLCDGFADEHGEPVVLRAGLYTVRTSAALGAALRRHLPDDADPARRHLVPEASCGTGARGPAADEPALPTGVVALDDLAVPSAPASTGPVADLVTGLVADLDARAAPGLAVSDRVGVRHVPGIASRGGARSVFGFGGVLDDGTLFCVALVVAVPVPAATVELFRAVAVSVQAGLLVHPHADGTPDPAARLDALHAHLRTLEQVSDDQAAALDTVVGRLRAEAGLVDTLQVVGQRLTAQLDLDVLVQEATDAATKATGAAFGAFFYNLIDQYGESYTLYTLSGVPREVFSRFPMPRNTAVFAPTFTGEGTVRSDDITRDPRYGRNEPHHGMPEGHLPVRSYLAVSVVSPSSQDVLGGFFFGHHETGRFTARHEQLAEGIAGYAAIALDNARLFAAQRATAAELARSMLPIVPHVPDLRIASRYLPAATGSEVGGDWFDVIELPAGRTAFVIGDVVGRGVKAAAVMGQIRTAVRSYAMLDLPPGDVLRHVSALAATVPGATFVTCFYAVHDPVDNTLTYANAGHLPAVLTHPDGAVDLIGEGLDMPIGVGETFTQRRASFPGGARLTLYTDGLVESRRRGLTDGLRELVAGLRDFPGGLDLQVACDKLIDRLTDGRHDDDVALLHVHHQPTHRRAATTPLERGPLVAAKARAFVARHLAEWGLTGVSDTALTVTSELVTNAVKHADNPGVLRLHHDGTRLTVDVADTGTSTPRVLETTLDEEGGRGLYLVNALTSRWGTRGTPDGKVVWAEIRTPAPPRPEA
ncbi:SpoIIE family protein phosphatase [Actinosynnema sp. NPDC050436]|uniref:ATP-binding SpoIIE family protein phosphatase n=1 Tax=Actinosynnema sp. NPDC050436 TaxID=3155659 RepID=UPI0033C28F57